METQEKIRQPGTENAGIPADTAVGGTDGKRSKKRGWKWVVLAGAVLLGVAAAVILVKVLGAPHVPKGVEAYTVQNEQYYVEYSEQYDYWDVITVEYPRIEGIDPAVQEQLNMLLYDTAMDRVNYWHLEPSDEVVAFQEEYFSIFSSDVSCAVPYHSQYLLSVAYDECYAPGNPVWYVNKTQRALTVDLLTGESYALTDIFEVNKDFVTMWDQAVSDELGLAYADEEMLDVLLDCFWQRDEEINRDFLCRSFFYLTENKDFVVGLSLDPVLEGVYTYEPVDRTSYAVLHPEDLEAFRKESGFWEKYELSEPAGETLPCEDKQENLWLGESGGAWQ